MIKTRLYLSMFVNTFGSWLTFLAIALVVKEKYGADQVAFVFLVQTLPAILFSRSLASWIQPQYLEKAFVGAQILLALNSLVLIMSQTLPVIYAHLFIGAILKSIANPIHNTLLGKWVPESEQKETFTRLNAIQTATLAIAPAIGAWIKIVFSVNLLFVLDAVTFLVAIAFLKELFVPSSKNLESIRSEKPSLRLAWISKPKDLPAKTWHYLKIWFLFLGIGAVLNAIEFSGFEAINLTDQQIGYALGFWGVGSLVAFVLPNPISFRMSWLLYAVSLFLFVMAINPLFVFGAFLLGGCISAYLSGALRAFIQGSIPQNYNALPVWAYSNQIVQLLNLIAYASAGALLKAIPFFYFGCFLILIAIPGFLLMKNVSANTVGVSR